MLLSEAWRSLTANLSTTFAATITVLIGMALVGMLVGFGTYARSWTDKTKKELVVHVYFCTDPGHGARSSAREGRPQINAVARQAPANPLVESIRYVSKEQALKELAKPHPHADYDLLPSNPLPDAFEIKPIKGESVDRSPASLDRRFRLEWDRSHSERRPPTRSCDVAHLIEVLFLVAVLILLDRLDAADREHDPLVDLLPPA